MYAHTTIGIDLGITTKHRACAISAGEPNRVMSIGTGPTELDALLDAVGGPDHVDVVLEPTGLGWVAPSVYLAEQGACVHRVDTRKAHGFRKVLSRNVKSDQADAEALARMLVIAPQDVRPLLPFDGPAFMLARLFKTREAIIDDRTQVILRIKALLPAYLPTLAARLAERSIGAVERVLLRDFLDPRHVLRVGPKGLRAAVDAAGHDARAHRTARLIESWVAAAEETLALYGDKMLFDFAQRQMRVLLAHFDSFEPLVEAIEVEITALYRQLDPAGLFETLSGVGPIVGAALCAALGGPAAIVERFPNANHLVSFVGLDPRKNQSGGNDREGQHISKSGSRSARRYLYLGAETARRFDPQLADFYERLRGRGKHHNCAVVAVAAKMLRRLYAVCKRAAAGDVSGYEVRDTNGQPLTSREARERVRARFPSKAARAKAQREARAKKRAERRAAQGTRQSVDSSRRSQSLDPAREYSNAGGDGEPTTGAASAASVVGSACAGLRS